MPITASLIVAGGIAAGKGIQSAVRAHRAKKEIESLQKGLKDPSREISPELMQTYNMIQRQGMDRQMPGMSNLRASQDIQTAAMLGDIGAMGGGSSVDRMAALQGAYQNRMLSEQEIGLKNADYLVSQQQDKIKNLMSMQPLIAQERQQQYEQNELNPFLRTSAAISALREKRYQESNNAFDAFSNAAMTAAGGIKGSGNVKIPKGTLTGGDSEVIENPAGYVDPGMSQEKMLEITGMNNTGGFNYQTPFVQAPNSISNYGNITGQLPMGNQVPASTNPYQQGSWGQTPQSVMDLIKALGIMGPKF